MNGYVFIFGRKFEIRIVDKRKYEIPFWRKYFIENVLLLYAPVKSATNILLL